MSKPPTRTASSSSGGSKPRRLPGSCARDSRRTRLTVGDQVTVEGFPIPGQLYAWLGKVTKQTEPGCCPSGRPRRPTGGHRNQIAPRPARGNPRRRQPRWRSMRCAPSAMSSSPRSFFFSPAPRLGAGDGRTERPRHRRERRRAAGRHRHRHANRHRVHAHASSPTTPDAT